MTDQNLRDLAWMEEPNGDNTTPKVDDLARALDDLYKAGPEAGAIEKAHARLRRTLEASLDPAVFIDSVEGTPLGDLHLAVSHHGLVALNFGVCEEAFIDSILSRFGENIRKSPRRTALYTSRIEAYLRGERTTLDLSVDLDALTQFQRQVLEATAQVPRGSVATYGEIAQRIGSPKAARAVGQALGRNPVPIVIPCHRVIAADGSLGGYSGGGGLRSKAALLQLEGATI
jgi:methylated-DNA-[protein]-cysteine S-methyltransferase